MEFVWTFIGNRMDFDYHNNCIFPYYGYCIEIVWIYYGFSGAIENFIVWISHFFPSEIDSSSISTTVATGYKNVSCGYFLKEQKNDSVATVCLLKLPPAACTIPGWVIDSCYILNQTIRVILIWWNN